MTIDTAYPSFLKPEPAATASPPPAEPAGPPWCVIVADDEPDVHTVTRAALEDFAFEGRGLAMVHVSSGAEAVQAVRDNPDAALLLLDVVMEDEHAGLDAIKRIRGELANQRIRIVLRTGQPGAAPEAQVIARYDINGYADKTELTRRKLKTLLYSCLRAFRDIQTIEAQVRVIDANRRGLAQVIDASATIFQLPGFARFTEGVLEQLSVLVCPDTWRGGVYARAPGVAAVNRAGDFTVVAGTGRFEDTVDRPLKDALPSDAVARILTCVNEGRGIVGPDEYIGVFPGKLRTAKVVYLAGRLSPEVNLDVVELFNRNVSIAFDNIELREVIEETQREIVYRLGGAVESRSKETASHVKRVATISRMLALQWGMLERDAEIFWLASPMHDLGKIGIADHILNKPGKLTAEEWTVMRTHPVIGHDLLRDSAMEILKVGAVVSLEHHEKWDGSGYPYGKRADEIGIHGRITAVVDVFDALSSRRCYKQAWAPETVPQHLRENAGSHFDPRIVELFFDNLAEVRAIAARYPD